MATRGFFNKALDALEPFQTQALEAIDASLGEKTDLHGEQYDYSTAAKAASKVSGFWKSIGIDKIQPEWLVISLFKTGDRFVYIVNFTEFHVIYPLK